MFFLKKHKTGRNIYVDSSSTCKSKCGSKTYPYQSISEGINAINTCYPNVIDWLFGSDSDFSDFDDWMDLEDSFGQYAYTNSSFSNDKTYNIIVKPGIYKGKNNKGISVSNLPINIISLEGSSRTIIDCEGVSKFVDVSNSLFQMNGFTVMNCRGNRGGAISLVQSLSVFNDLVFLNNSASYGGSIYLSYKGLSMTNVQFKSNWAWDKGGSIYFEYASLSLQSTTFSCSSVSPSKDSISCISSSASFDNPSLTGVGVSCDSSCEFGSDDQVNYCSTVQVCSGGPDGGNGGDLCLVEPIKPKCNNNSICDILEESCLGCESDCPSCNFNGMRLISYQGCNPSKLTDSCIYNIQAITTPFVEFFMKNVPICPVAGNMFGYFTVPESSVYEFQLIGSNIGAFLQINGRTVVNSMFHHTEFYSTFKVQLDHTQIHNLNITFASFSSLDRNMTLNWRSKETNPFELMKNTYFSKNICGDKILDPLEKQGKPYYCPRDTQEFKDAYCGDGICQEEFPNLCIIDCYDQITPDCPGQNAPTKLDKDYPTHELVGTLLNNQYLYRLPGLEHLMHGFDIYTGEGKVSNLFSFSFCENDSISVIQDTYRGLVYTIPKDLFATFHPSCRYEATSNEFKSSSEIASSMSESHSMQASAEIGGGPKFIQVAAKSTFAKEKSVESARSINTISSGSLFKTDAKCLVSKVQLHKYTFHPNFLKSISQVEDELQMLDIINEYGTHFYKSVSLGGKLTQITVISEETKEEFSSSEMKDSLALSFSASVSAPILKVSGSYYKSQDNEVSTTTQKSFNTKTVKTSVITYGGAPGAYSSDESGSISSFGAWASSLDQLPVPIDYQLGAIGNIIPKTWTTRNGTQILNLWLKAEAKYYETLPVLPSSLSKEASYRVTWFYDTNRTDVSQTLRWCQSTISIKGNDATSIPTKLTLMENRRGYYAPIKWVEGVSTANKSPVVFSFLGSPYEIINSITTEITCNGTSVLSNPHQWIKTSKIYIFDNKGVYKFLPSGSSSTLTPIDDFQGLLIFQINFKQSGIFTESHKMEITFNGVISKFSMLLQPSDFPNNLYSGIYNIEKEIEIPTSIGDITSVAFNAVSDQRDIEYYDESTADPTPFIDITDFYLSQKVCVNQNEIETPTYPCPSDFQLRRKLKTGQNVLSIGIAYNQNKLVLK
ncbi:hypothetical protein DLAC_06287 [Tieghemostelium lacteum]|uniref:MACPF domain-containing protein n=1 Tax=Tieghemostelium lacteum TaxID=361077 RepID=A0A151ZEK7_TIELA|nr:hypothetical protein DLAC_06287 [Tieghemostelium lacteum]|eukprot:KYQ92324.1 hypothetical protein DLAC_06287 [Tieghemostelium lacteum]